MKTKKFWRTLLTIVMSGVAAFACFGMAACDNSQGGGNTTNNGSNNGDNNGDNTGSNNGGNNGDNNGSSNGGNNGDNTGDNTGDNNGDNTGDNNGDNSGSNTGEDTSQEFTGKIYLVGDSTVCSFNDNYYLPRYGYGTQLYNYIHTNEANIVNLALSGRSSLSFLTESNYTTLTSSIASGDYLIIGFGHNDEKSEDPARFTNPNKTYDDTSTTNGASFQNTLYENYVKMAKDKGATPILCTPIVRYSSTADYSGTKAHITSDGNYAQAIKTLGEATNTTVIDLTAITKDDYTKIGTEAAYYHAHTTYTEANNVKTPDGRDDTHINMYGAKMVSYELVTALKSTDCTLKNYVKTNITKPEKDVELANSVNSKYVKSDYEAFDPENTDATKVATIGGQNWYKTVLGDVGGASKLNTYTIGESNGTITIGNDGNNGKFSSTADGFGAVFVQVDASKNFTASANVKVTNLGNSVSNQSAVGLMLRDDIYVDTYMTTLTSNFVAAAAIAKDNTAIFSRSSASALAKESNSTSVAVGSTYSVSIERVGQVVIVTLNDGTSNYTKTYTDFDFQAVDNGHMYLCLFANRGITAEFTNVTFEITGDSQGA